MAQWKKVLVSGSNISELVNDKDYLLSVGSGVVSSSAQITLGGDLTGTADNAGIGVGVISNGNIAPNAAISYTKVDFDGSTILSGSIDFSAYATTASLDALSSSLEARVSTNESDIADLQAFSSSLDAQFVTEAELTALSSSVETRFIAVEGDISTNASDIATNAADISSLDGRVTANEGNITTLQGDVSTLQSDVTSLDGRVTTNEGDIFTLQGDVSTNTSNISSLDGRLTTAEGNIINLQSDVATNASDIATNAGDIATLQSDLATEIAKTNGYTSSFTTETLIVTSNAAVTGTFGVQGNTSFGADVIVEGNLTVNGTASFINVEELSIKDKFITLASGSNSLTDAGIIFQSSTTGVGSGPALFLEATSTGDYGRMAMATSVDSNATAATPAAYVTTTEVGTGAAPASPTFGGTTNGFGNIYVDSATGDIFIYA